MKDFIRFSAGIAAALLLTGCGNAELSAPPTTQPTVPTTQATAPTIETTAPTTSPTEPSETTPPPITGWMEQDGNRYYYFSDGTPCTGWAEVEGLNRYFAEDGRLCTGWLDDNEKRYYLDENGSPTLGWLELEGNKYYFRLDGTIAKGKVTTPTGETRYFTSAGKEVILVNPWNTIPKDYSVTLGGYRGWQVAEECIPDLERMMDDCKAAGHSAVVVSAYRTHEYQANLFKNRIQRFLNQGYSQEKAEIEAAKRVAVPGTSEHELGLALDIVDESYQNLNSQQETTPAQKWLMENSWKYGFILRYPNEKTEITGIIYEPWHYRYVGIELSTELHELDLCLEEYLAQLTESNQ